MPDEELPHEELAAAFGARFRLASPLGRGAFGEVFLAEDALSGLSVAIKSVPVRDPREAARLRREVGVLRVLRVPGVVRLVDEGTVPGRFFIVTELARGAPFPGRPGPVPWAELALVSGRLLEILGRLHAAGVVHRDLKPSNVLVDEDGHVSVLDFGLSSLSVLTDRDEREGLSGTPAYLAPEQLRGQEATQESDLYAVGLMLFEALTGRLPHDTSSLAALTRTRLSTRHESLAMGDAPDAVRAAIVGLLATEPSARVRSAAEAQRALSGEWRPSTELERLGDPAVLSDVTEALATGLRVTVVGPAQSGRTRLLRDAEQALAARKYTVRRLGPGASPFESLLSALELVVDAELALPAFEALAKAELEQLHARRRCLLVDDDATIDRWSLELIAAAGDHCPIAVVERGDDAPRRGRVVELAPLAFATLVGLFSGPERLLHLASDAARILFDRTGGLAGNVARELARWLEGGFARWDHAAAPGGARRLTIRRDALERLELGLVQRGESATAHDPAELEARASELLAFLALQPQGLSLSVLRSALHIEHWHAEALLEHLARRGMVQKKQEPGSERHWVLHAPLHLDELWTRDRIASAHQRLGGAMPMGASGRLAHLVLGSRDQDPATAQSIADESRTLAARLACEGRLAHAAVIVSEGLRATRMVDDAGVREAQLLELLVRIGFAEGSATPLDRALYELYRAGLEPARRAQLSSLVEAAQASLVWSERAHRLALAVPAFDDTRIDRWRQWVRFVAARRSSIQAEREEVVAIEAWAAAHTDDDDAIACRAGLVGRHRYREGRFAEAADLHQRAADREPWASLRIGALLQAASCWMEARRYHDAARVAALAQRGAADARSAALEARAEWILRCIAYREGRTTGADRELCEASRHIGAEDTEALIALNEAAAAFRAGDLDEARALALAAAGSWAIRGEKLGGLLATALAAAAGEPLDADARARVEQDAPATLPAVALQAIGLLARGGQASRRLRDAVPALLARVAPEERGHRQEVTSVDEAVAWLKADVTRGPAVRSSS